MASSISLSEIDCVTVDGFGMLQLLKISGQKKAGAALVNAVCLWVDNKTKTKFITYNSTYGETTNNHKEADTLLIHCITFSKPDDKFVWVYASEVDVAVLLTAHRNLLGCRNVYFGFSAAYISW